MKQEHQVWAIPPKGKKPEFFAAFDLDRWQWAEKLAEYLRERGLTEITIRRCLAPEGSKCDGPH